MSCRSCNEFIICGGNTDFYLLIVCPASFQFDTVFAWCVQIDQADCKYNDIKCFNYIILLYTKYKLGMGQKLCLMIMKMKMCEF